MCSCKSSRVPSAWKLMSRLRFSFTALPSASKSQLSGFLAGAQASVWATTTSSRASSTISRKRSQVTVSSVRRLGLRLCVFLVLDQRHTGAGGEHLPAEPVDGPRCWFMTSSYSSRFLRMSKLCPSTRFWALSMDLESHLCSMTSPSCIPSRSIQLEMRSEPKIRIKSSSSER